MKFPIKLQRYDACLKSTNRRRTVNEAWRWPTVKNVCYANPFSARADFPITPTDDVSRMFPLITGLWLEDRVIQHREDTLSHSLLENSYRFLLGFSYSVVSVHLKHLLKSERGLKSSRKWPHVSINSVTIRHDDIRIVFFTIHFSTSAVAKQFCFSDPRQTRLYKQRLKNTECVFFFFHRTCRWCLSGVCNTAIGLYR